ncbi:MAG TPA: YfhO family protein [Mucilaginibacter sp.]
MNNWFKKNGVHFVITAIFLAACFFFFTPAFQGKTLGQGDVMRAQSTQKEINDYKKRDTTILWTNQILGGMPAYQIWAPWPNNIANQAINVLDHVFPSPIYIVFLLLFGGYFLFSVLKLNPWLAAAGALAFTFSSYNIIYIAAGHVNQELAIALFAPIVASIILVMNGRFILGSSLLALFLSLEIKANHIQMTYYLLLALLILLIIELVNAIRNKTLPFFGKALTYIACATLLAVAVNASTLWSTAEYAGDSIRGKSNLTKNTTEAKSGVARDYAYEFSEGVGETLTFLIPNAYGGATNGQASDDSKVAKLLIEKGADASQAQNIAQSLPLYWGDKRFTEGPWYFGAIVVFLFIFGLFIIKNRIKWWLLATVILTMLLSFGGNFPLISDLFFNYFPLYNKFRAVESILAVASLCFPIMAFLAIKEAIDNPDKKALFSKAKIALYITGGLTLIIAIVPDLLLSFKSANHQQLIDSLTQMARGDSGLGNALASALVQDRISAARADAVRTLIFLAIGFGILWAYFKGKINVLVLSILLLAVTLVDLWTVDKRYLKDEYYTERQENPTPQPREVDTFIAKDTDPDFKVLDLSQNIMEDAITPFFNKSIGGYSAARMKRYNELIESQFSKSVNHSVLDMLNTKYIIIADPKTNNLSMTRNETACGHAWFVKSVKYAKDADQEMQTISAFSPKDEAIVDQRYKSIIDEKAMGYDPNGTIKLVKYSPDDMVYQSGTTAPSVAVFSEIYYDKGWKMYIDGKESPYFRADYVLRAAQIPVGNHKIEFIFHPASYYTGEKISLAGSILLVLALGGAIYTGIKRKPEDEKKAA